MCVWVREMVPRCGLLPVGDQHLQTPLQHSPVLRSSKRATMFIVSPTRCGCKIEGSEGRGREGYGRTNFSVRHKVDVANDSFVGELISPFSHNNLIRLAVPQYPAGVNNF